MGHASEGTMTGWAADFRFRWVPAAHCEMATAEYDHFRCIFRADRVEAERAPDGISLRAVIIESAPWAVPALAAGREATSWHRVICIDGLGDPYAPFEDTPNLFLKLADLGKVVRQAKDRPSMEIAVLTWLREHGPLGVWRPVVVPRAIGGGGVGVSGLEPLEYFTEEAVRMAFLVDLYRDVLNDDMAAIRERFCLAMVGGAPEFEVPGDPLFTVYGPPPLPGLRHMLPRSNREWVWLGLRYLINVIGTYFSPLGGHWLHTVVPAIARVDEADPSDLEGDDPWWEVERGWACNTLLAAMYVQFLDFVCRKKAALTCRHCGKWFAPKKRGAEFCSPRCRGAHFYHTKKSALEMHKAGVATAGIATRLGVSKERVARWVRETG